MARQCSACFACRVAIRRHGCSRWRARSPRWRARYTARSQGPRRRSCGGRGMAQRRPRRRRSARICRRRDPWSPQTRAGRIRGRLAPGRCPAPRVIHAAHTVAACGCPGGHTQTPGWPAPSTRRWPLVPPPPRARPHAGSPPPLGRPPRGDGPARRGHPHHGRPTPVARRWRPAVATRPAGGPRDPAAATGKTGWSPSATGRSAPAGRATARRCAAPTGCHG